MHPLSIFPQLLFLSNLAPFLLRIAVAILILSLGYERSRKNAKWAGIIYVAIGVLIFIGLYTQPVSILAILLIIIDFFFDRKTTPATSEKRNLYLIACIILFTLIVTGPGSFALDLPL